MIPPADFCNEFLTQDTSVWLTKKPPERLCSRAVKVFGDEQEKQFVRTLIINEECLDYRLPAPI